MEYEDLIKFDKFKRKKEQLNCAMCNLNVVVTFIGTEMKLKFGDDFTNEMAEFRDALIKIENHYTCMLRTLREYEELKKWEKKY